MAKCNQLASLPFKRLRTVGLKIWVRHRINEQSGHLRCGRSTPHVAMRWARDTYDDKLSSDRSPLFVAVIIERPRRVGRYTSSVHRSRSAKPGRIAETIWLPHLIRAVGRSGTWSSLKQSRKAISHRRIITTSWNSMDVDSTKRQSAERNNVRCSDLKALKS